MIENATAQPEKGSVGWGCWTEYSSLVVQAEQKPQYAVLVLMVKRKRSISGFQPEGGRSNRLYRTVGVVKLNEITL